MCSPTEYSCPNKGRKNSAKKIVKTARHSRLCYNKDDVDVMEASGDGGQARPSVGGLLGGTPNFLKPRDCLIPTSQHGVQPNRLGSCWNKGGSLLGGSRPHSDCGAQAPWTDRGWTTATRTVGPRLFYRFPCLPSSNGKGSMALVS